MTSDAHETETDRLGSNGTKEHLNAQPATFTTSHHAASPSLGSLATTTSTVSHSNSVSVSGSASDLDAPQTPSDVDGGSASLHGGHSELAIVGGTDTDVQQRPGYTSVTMGQGSDMAAAAAATQKRMSSAAAFEAALGGQRTSSAKDAEIKRLSSISNATAIAVASSPSAVTDSSPSLEHSRIATPLPPPPPGPKPHRLSSASLGSCDSSSRKSFMALPVVAKHNATSSIETTKRASLPISAIASPTTPTLTASNQAIRLPSEEQRRNRVSSTASSSSSSRSVGKRPPTPPAKPANLVVAVNQAMSRQQDNDESANGNGSRSSAPSSASNAESWLLVSTPAEAAGKMIGGSPLEEQETTPAVDVTDMEMLSEGPTAGQVPSAMARQASSGSERGGALGIGRPSSIASSLGAASTSSGEPVRLPVAFSAEAQSAPASFADRPTHIRKSSFSRVLDSFAVGSALRSGNSTPGVTTKSSVQPPSVAAKPSWLKRTASSSKNLATKSLGFATKERSPSMRTVELQADQPGPPSLPPRQTRPGGSGQAGATAPTISLDAQDDLPLSRSRSKSPAPAVESDSLLPLPPPPRREFGSRGRSMEVPRSASSSLGPSDSGNRLRTGLNVVNKRLGSWANDNQAVRQNLGQAPSMIGSAMSSGWSALRASRSSTSPSIAAGITGDTISPGFADGSQIPPGIIKRPRLPGSSSAVFGQDPTQAALLWPVVDAESVSSFDNNSRRSKRRKCLPAVATRCVDFCERGPTSSQLFLAELFDRRSTRLCTQRRRHLSRLWPQQSGHRLQKAL